MAWGWITSQSWPHWDLDITSVELSNRRTKSSLLGYDELQAWNPEHPRMTVGSVASAIAHHSKSPILLVRDRSEDEETV